MLFNLRKPTRYDFEQGVERAGRAFVATAIAIYPAQTLLEQIAGDQAVDVDLLKKAIVSGSVAAVALLWRWLLPDFGRSKPDPVADPAVPNPPAA